MDYLSLNRLNTRFTVVKTDSAILYKASYTLCGDQNGPLQASLHGQNALSFHRPPTCLVGVKTDYANTIYGGQNPHSEPLQVVKTHSTSIYKPNIRFVVDKTGSLYVVRPTTRFAVVKRVPSFYGPPTNFAVVKSRRTLRTSYSYTLCSKKK